MARIRSIKPDFFLDDEIAALPALARLLYVGLWTQADKAGRLKDKPVRIKTAILPYDDCDMDALLDELFVAGFITRYEVEGDGFIEVKNFDKHQRFNNESPSVLPPVSEGYARTNVAVIHGRKEGKGRKGEESSLPLSEKTASHFRAVNDRLVGEYGTILTAPQVERLRILADRYGDEALARIEYGIRRAAEADKQNTGYALTVAEGASKQELSPKEAAPDPFFGRVTLGG